MIFQDVAPVGLVINCTFNLNVTAINSNWTPDMMNREKELWLTERNHSEIGVFGFTKRAGVGRQLIRTKKMKQNKKGIVQESGQRLSSW